MEVSRRITFTYKEDDIISLVREHVERDGKHTIKSIELKTRVQIESTGYGPFERDDCVPVFDGVVVEVEEVK